MSPEDLPPLPAEEDATLPPPPMDDELPPLPADDELPPPPADDDLPLPPVDDELPLPPPPAATLAPKPVVGAAPATPAPAGKSSSGKLPLILAAGLCLGAFGIYMSASSGSNPGSGSDSGTESGNESSVIATIPTISPDEAASTPQGDTAQKELGANGKKASTGKGGDAISPEAAIDMLIKYDIIDQFASGEMVTSVTSDFGKEYKQNPIKSISKDLLYHFMMYKDGVEEINEYPYIDTIIDLYRRANTDQEELKAQGLAKLSDDLDAANKALGNAFESMMTGQTLPQEKQQEKTIKRLPVKCLEAFSAAGCRIKDPVACFDNAIKVGIEDKKLIGYIFSQSAIDDPASVNAKLRNGWTRLMYVVRYGTSEDCAKALQAGADVNLANDDSVSALMLAAGYGDAKVCRALISAGANVNAKDDSGWTSLMWALRYGSSENAEYIMTNGADVNAKNNDGWTCLMFAARNSSGSMCKKLVEAGAEINQTRADGATALMVSCYNNEHPDVFDQLLQLGADINIPKNDGSTLLFNAIDGSNEEISLKLIESGANVNACRNDGWSPLIMAALKSSGKIAAKLIEKGADVEAKAQDGSTPLYAAALKGDIDILNLLLESGADPHQTLSINGNPTTLLHVAATQGNDQVCAKLIELGVDVYRKNSDNKTPLDLAHSVYSAVLHLQGPFVSEEEKKKLNSVLIGKKNYDDVIALLAKAEEEQKDRKPNAERADTASQPETQLNRLIEDLASASYNTAVERLYQKRLLQLLPMIRDGESVDVVLPDMNGTTALHNACGLSRVDVVRWLVDHGADLDAKTAKGASVEKCVGGSNAAEIARILRDARQGRSGATSSAGGGSDRAALQPFINEIVSMRTSNSTMQLYQKRLSTLLPMIRDGADVDISPAEMKGNTALHYACGMGNPELVQWLVEHGADVNKRTNKGASPLGCVGGANGAQIRSFLMQHGAVK